MGDDETRGRRALPWLAPGSSLVAVQPLADARGLHLRLRDYLPGPLGRADRLHGLRGDAVRGADRVHDLRGMCNPGTLADPEQRQLREEGRLPSGDPAVGDARIDALPQPGERCRPADSLRVRACGPPLDGAALAAGRDAAAAGDLGAVLVPRL